MNIARQVRERKQYEQQDVEWALVAFLRSLKKESKGKERVSLETFAFFFAAPRPRRRWSHSVAAENEAASS